MALDVPAEELADLVGTERVARPVVDHPGLAQQPADGLETARRDRLVETRYVERGVVLRHARARRGRRDRCSRGDALDRRRAPPLTPPTLREQRRALRLPERGSARLLGARLVAATGRAQCRAERRARVG